MGRARVVVGTLLSGRGIAAGLLVIGLTLAGLRLERSMAGELRTMAAVVPLTPSAPVFDIGTHDSSWTDSRCGSCHNADESRSHPVGIVPSMPVPSDLPLENGRMTCLTCHSSTVESHREARRSGDPMLRTAEGADTTQLCIQCHDGETHTRSAQHGASTLQAHFWAHGQPTSSEESSAGSGQVDAQSQRCLSCHDGLISQDIAIGGSAALLEMGGPEHPVGIGYDRSRHRYGESLPLVASSMLDPRIQLIGSDGQVGCTSCHNPYSPEKNLLVMSNRHSRLCLSCHVD